MEHEKMNFIIIATCDNTFFTFANRTDQGQAAPTLGSRKGVERRIYGVKG